MWVFFLGLAPTLFLGGSSRQSCLRHSPWFSLHACPLSPNTLWSPKVTKSLSLKLILFHLFFVPHNNAGFVFSLQSCISWDLLGITCITMKCTILSHRLCHAWVIYVHCGSVEVLLCVILLYSKKRWTLFIWIILSWRKKKKKKKGPLVAFAPGIII